MPRDIQEVSASVGMTRGKFEKRRIVSNWNKSVNCGSLKGSQVKEMNLMAGLWLMSLGAGTSEYVNLMNSIKCVLP